MSIFGIIYMSIMMQILIKDYKILQNIYISYWGISILGGIIGYLACEYMSNFNRSYRELRYYKMMANNMTDFISTLKSDTSYLYVSPSVTGVLGYTQEELSGKSSLDFIHEEDLPSICNLYSNMFQARNEDITTYRFRKKDGNYIWFETTLKSIINGKGTVEEVICVSRDITARKEIEQELQRLSNIDGLTGLENRRRFDEALEREWQVCAKNSKLLSLIMIDMDYFKLYNDTYGHLIGDECLKAVAKILLDIEKGVRGIAARYGGEELTVLLPEKSIEEAKKIAEEIRGKIEDLLIPNEKANSNTIVTGSIGVTALVPNMNCSSVMLILKADKALYRAKKEGRNKISIEV